MNQLPLNLDIPDNDPPQLTGTYRDKLEHLLNSDLDFSQHSSKRVTHDLHTFAARFPPQLPRVFIRELTTEGDVVVDPMSGSGTTILESYLSERRGIGFDIDPIAALSARVKSQIIPATALVDAFDYIINNADKEIKNNNHKLTATLHTRFDEKSLDFIDYWFSPTVQIELQALIRAIKQIDDPLMQDFFLLTFSSVIITKNGGVSLARDLAHTRPHKVQDKPYQSSLELFKKRFQQNYKKMQLLPQRQYVASIAYADAQHLPMAANSTQLIVTSPPYVANAIDYMRAHKFTLVWLGYTIDELSQRRRQYIGSESTIHTEFEQLDTYTQNVINTIDRIDNRKARGVTRYYSEMKRALGEMYRILQPGRSAIIVVGTSRIRGIDTETHLCLAKIGQQLGFELVNIGTRRIDRNRRMMPARNGNTKQTQIENRMHEEYVIGLLKPDMQR